MDADTGRRIRAWREHLGKRQNRVALAAMLPTDVLSKIESGARRVAAEEFRRIADALGVAVDSLYDEPPEPPPSADAA